MRVKDAVGVLAGIARTLADAGISVDAMLQQDAGDTESESQTDIVILTHFTRKRNSMPRSRV